jgi:hypothetical protein
MSANDYADLNSDSGTRRGRLTMICDGSCRATPVCADDNGGAMKWDEDSSRGARDVAGYRRRRAGANGFTPCSTCTLLGLYFLLVVRLMPLRVYRHSQGTA